MFDTPTGWSWGRIRVVVLALAGATILGLPCVAGAASKTYPGQAAQTLADTASGWTSRSAYDGLCVPAVTCPALSGEYLPSGGAGGGQDGYLRTSSGPTTVAALLSTSSHVWRGPAFRYKGINGDIPADLTFRMSKRSGFGALLNLGVEAEYSVVAVNRSGGVDVPLVTGRSVGRSDTWQGAGAQSVVPGSLRVGSRYSIEIRTSIGGLAAVLPGGHVDYDNVRLTASDKDGPGSGGPGSGGENGGGAVLPPPRVVPPAIGYLYKNRLFVRVKCPKRFRPKCQTRASLVTRKKRGKVMSRPMRAGIKSGRWVRKGLRIRPALRARISRLAKVRRKTVVLRLNIRSKRGNKKGVVFHRLRVLERRR
jgi:hypothetical protein